MSDAGAGRARESAGQAGVSHEFSDAVPGVSRQNDVYRRAMEVCDELADTVLAGAGPGELTCVFAALVGKRVVLMDAVFAPLAQASDDATDGWDTSDPRTDRLLRALVVKRRPLRVPPVPGSPLEQGCLITPIVVDHEPLGYLLVLDNVDAEAGDRDGGVAEPDDVDLLTATYAATLFALTLARERTNTELGQRYQRAIADALLSGQFLDVEDARQKARALGLDDGNGFRVGVVHTAGDSQAIARRLSAVLPAAIVTPHEHRVVIILPAAAATGSAAALERRWTRIAGTVDETVTCGLSEYLAHAEDATRGLREAQQAIDLGVRLGRTGQLVRYDDLGIYRLLLRIGDMSELAEFAVDVLGAVLDYEDAHHLDLVQTLSAYLRCQGSLKQAARILHVHPNTVAYRTQRIEKLTGLDLSDPDDRLLAHTAIKIIEAQRSTGS